jgi:hypothetical protein
VLDDYVMVEARRVVTGMDAALALEVDHFDRLPSDLIPEGSPLGWYGAAFHYLLRGPGPSVGDKAFAPMLETTTGVYPDPLGEVPAEARELWEFGAALSTNAGVAARLHHLCFAAGSRNRGAHLREAAAAYLTLGQHADVPRVERVAALRWALELSALMRDESRAAAVLDASWEDEGP